MHPHRSSASPTGAVSRRSPHPSRSATLTYEGRCRRFPALAGMKPPQFSVWMFAQRWFRSADELVDLYPGSGAVAAGLSARHGRSASQGVLRPHERGRRSGLTSPAPM